MEIKLLHLYYDIMNLYGEYGNIRVLTEHIKDQGFEVTIDRKTIGEEKDFDKYDFIYIGCGTEKNFKVILEDIKINKEDLEKYIESGKVILLTGNSYEILGKSIDEISGLEIFNFSVETIEKRTITDVICTSEIFKNKIVGFINNMSKIGNNENTFLNIEWGLGKEQQEGILYKNVYATHLIGPILVRNPEILSFIVKKICENKDDNFIYKEIEYLDEQRGYELVLKELEARNNNK